MATVAGRAVPGTVQSAPLGPPAATVTVSGSFTSSQFPTHGAWVEAVAHWASAYLTGDDIGHVVSDAARARTDREAREEALDDDDRDDHHERATPDDTDEHHEAGQGVSPMVTRAMRTAVTRATTAESTTPIMRDRPEPTPRSVRPERT